MSTKYLIRQKDYESPEKVQDESGTVDSPDKILENLEEFSKYHETMFDFMLEIDNQDLGPFINSLNRILDPNIALEFEYFKINRLRKAVYNMGHILIADKGLETLEKIGFSFVEEQNKLFLIGNHHTPVPDFLTPDKFFESIAVLFKQLSCYGSDDSYMWSFSDKIYYAAVIKNGVLVVEHCPAA